MISSLKFAAMRRDYTVESGQGWCDYTDDDHSGQSREVEKGERGDTGSRHEMMFEGSQAIY